MRDRESILALLIGAGLAVAVHLALVPAAARILGAGDDREGEPATARPLNDPPVPEEREEEPPTPERTPPDPPKPPDEPEVPLGKDDAPKRSTVAWISHEDFEQLLARQSTTEQPALQREVDPTPEAPIEPDPTQLAQAGRSGLGLTAPPTAPSEPSQAQDQPQPEDASMTGQGLTYRSAAEGPEPLPVPPAEQPRAEGPTQDIAPPITQAQAVAPRQTENPPSLTDPTPTPVTLDPAPTPAQVADAIQPGEGRDRFEPAQAPERLDTPPTDQPSAETEDPKEQGKPVELAEATAKAPDPAGLPTQTSPSDAQEQQEQEDKSAQTATPPVSSPPPAESREARPTSAARSESEADPVSLTSSPVRVRPGSVLTGQGIQIRPARPEISVVSMLTAVPANPTARITFNPQGKVIAVKMLTTTGYPDFDAPIEASLYRWQASGVKLKELGRPFSLEITLLLHDR